MSVFFPFPIIHTVNHGVKRIDHNVKTPQFNIVEHTVIHSVKHNVIHTMNESEWVCSFQQGYLTRLSSSTEKRGLQKL